jgi:hypothetical protein
MDQLHKRYTISWFNPKTNEIEVYFRRSRLVRPFLIELPVVGGSYPEGQDLENYILSFEPINKVEKTIDKAENADYIQSLIKVNTKLSLDTISAKEQAIKKRSAMLYASDWTQLPDAQDTLDAEEKLRWSVYRQQLRDITKQPGWPTSIDWPKRPFLFGVTSYE